MKRYPAPIFALLLAISLATIGAGFPVINGNTYKKARYYPVMDTMAIPVDGRYRGIYLIEPASGSVRAGVDSLLELWRNGGAAPKFRKIQRLIIWNNSVDEEQWRLTIFDTRGTSHMRWVNQPYQVLDLPLEADSIQIQSDPFATFGTDLDVSYIVW